jgi:hypothetical protein
MSTLKKYDSVGEEWKPVVVGATGPAGPNDISSSTTVTGLTGVLKVASGVVAGDATASDVGAYPDTNPSGFTTNTGTVTSVDLTAGTGISVTGAPVTTSGNITVTNTAPDQVVSLIGAGATSVSGTYPSFTITSTDTNTTYTAGTGLDLTGTVFSIDSTVATLTGTQNLTNKTLTSPAINTATISGGTINNAIIGGTTRAAGSFTTLDANGNVILGDATADTISANGRFNTDVVPSTDNARDLGTSTLKWKQVYATTFTENGFPIVTQTDIGTAPNEIPLNQFLGNLAFMNSNQLVINPTATAVPSGIGDMVFELASDTSLVVKVRGSDGTVRSVALTLA